MPQGSILGPLLFLLYINDIVNCSNKLRFILFADDTNIFISDVSFSSLLLNVNIELHKLSEWFCANRLSLNIKKSNYMLFGHKFKRQKNLSSIISISGINIERVESTKFLGIHIDCKLNWKCHTSYLALKISKSIGIINKLKYILPRKHLLVLYNTLIHPYLLYCNVIWGNATQSAMHRLTILQKRILRIVCKAGFQDPSSKLFKQLNILKLDDVFTLQAAIFMFKAKNNMLPPSCSHHVSLQHSESRYNLRKRFDFFRLPYRTNIYERYIAISGPAVWESLPVNVRSTDSISLFIKNVTTFLMNNY